MKNISVDKVRKIAEKARNKRVEKLYRDCLMEINSDARAGHYKAGLYVGNYYMESIIREVVDKFETLGFKCLHKDATLWIYWSPKNS